MKVSNSIPNIKKMLMKMVCAFSISSKFDPSKEVRLYIRTPKFIRTGEVEQVGFMVDEVLCDANPNVAWYGGHGEEQAGIAGICPAC